MPQEFAIIGAGLSMLLTIATLIGLAVKAAQRREAEARAEGARLEAMNQMKRDIDALGKKIGDADYQSREDGRVLAGIQATLQALVNSVNDMRIAFLAHVDGGQK